ncbi:MAG: hypothetical protein ABIN61_06590 [candidate division WOR-3 bacterium]
MKRNFFFSILLLIISNELYSEILEIPEIRVFGERKVEIKAISKELLPFEEEYLEPIFTRNKRDLPKFDVIEEREKREGNLGINTSFGVGTHLEGYLLGYVRDKFFPLEVGINLKKNLIKKTSLTELFSRALFKNFYLSFNFYDGDFYNSIYRFSIGTLYNIANLSFLGVYSDSLIGVFEADFNINPFRFNIQIEEDIDYNIKALFEKYPFQVGGCWFSKKLYPEITYFFPINGFYIKSGLFNKTGIAYLYCPSPEYLIEYSSKKTYYRFELGQTLTEIPISIIFSHYLENSSNFLGIKGTHKTLSFEIGYPLNSGSFLFIQGLNTKILKIIETSLFSYIEGYGNYFFDVQFGYNLRYNLKTGIESSFSHGWDKKDNFRIKAYFYLSFGI